MWKVYNIESGKTLKAGFESEELAKDWLGKHEDLITEDFEVEEMDPDEIDEYNSEMGEDDDDFDEDAAFEEEEADDDDDDLDDDFDDDEDLDYDEDLDEDDDGDYDEYEDEDDEE